MADDNMRIVPERDDIRPRQSSAKRSSSPKSSSAPRKVKPEKNPSGSSFFTLILMFFIVLLSGASAFLYLQTIELNEEKQALSNRVAEIESKLSVTDESLSQSGAALQAVLQEHSGELELHMTEIRKLWGVSYDRNRIAIEELKNAQKKSDSLIATLQGKASQFDTITQGYPEIESRLETLSTQLLVQSATVDDLASTDRELSDGLNKITSGVSTQSKDIVVLQEAIDAIDQYRLQINQRLLRLEGTN